jgi:hypothetical protein
VIALAVRGWWGFAGIMLSAAESGHSVTQCVGKVRESVTRPPDTRTLADPWQALDHPDAEQLLHAEEWHVNIE